MNIKKDYINKTKEYLKDLRMMLTRKKMLKDEIDMLKERQSIEGGITFGEGIKSSNTYRGIEDLIITYDAQICCKEAETERIEHFIRMHELYTRSINSIEKKIIDFRYLEADKEKSFSIIAKELKYSKSQIARMHDEAIEKLAFYVFGDEATYI